MLLMLFDEFWGFSMGGEKAMLEEFCWLKNKLAPSLRKGEPEPYLKA